MLGLLLAGLLQAAQPSPQQLFDQATAALDAGHYAEASAILQPLVARLSASPKSSGLALARLRLGEAQQGQGQFAEAATTIRAALAAGPFDSPALVVEKVGGLNRLADVEQNLDDGVAAQRDYEAALKLATDPVQRATALGNLAKMAIFDDSATALIRAQEAVALVDKVPTASKLMRASYHVILGRVLLNAGRFDDAGKELAIAIDLFGGLTEKTSVLGAMARGDMAIALMLQGQDGKARKYLAYTGMGDAGYEGGPFTIPADNRPPTCGEESGIKPDDMAIVEFKIDDDGTVSGVQPIYATRLGPMALAFADAVRSWSWKPAEAAKIKPFFRAAARVELRCATTSEPPYMLSVLTQDVNGWLASRNIAASDVDEPDARAYSTETAALARQEAITGKLSVELVPILSSIMSNHVAAQTERVETAARAEAIVRSAKAPATVIAYFAITRARYEGDQKQGGQHAQLTALVSDPVIASDPRARAVARLALAEASDYRERIPVLQQVADDQALAAQDPLRIGALVRLASAEVALGDLAAARAAFNRTGLSEQACAVVDARPSFQSVNNSDRMFPTEAMQWGFEGWAVTSFDIAADGHTRNVRAVIVYPPLVFGPSAVKVLSTALYSQSYRPDGGPGCSGATRNVRFGIPQYHH